MKVPEKPKVGVWSLIDSFHVLQTLLNSDVDFIIFDFEHGYWRREQLATAVNLCRSEGKYSVARIPSPQINWVQLAYDANCDVLQVAGIKSQSGINEIARVTKIPPVGDLGYSPWTPRGYSKKDGLSEFPKISIQIEEISFLKRFINDELEFFPALDSIFVGRYDLSVSMGIAGEIEKVELMEFLILAVAKAKEIGVSIGTVSTSKADFEKLWKIGADFVSMGSDVHRLLYTYPVKGD